MDCHNRKFERIGDNESILKTPFVNILWQHEIDTWTWFQIEFNNYVRYNDSLEKISLKNDGEFFRDRVSGPILYLIKIWV